MTAPEYPFRDRSHAGRVLARKLEHYRGRADLLVLALPRGGVAVAAVVANALGAQLDVLVVRKLGFPGHEEYAIGAIASGGVEVLNPDTRGSLAADRIEAVIARERIELARRERLYRGDRPMPELRGRTVIVVDDGLATGSTMRAAVIAVRRQQPARICIAVPVGARQTCELLRGDADEIICAEIPNPFHAVGLAYVDFHQIGDDEVHALLEAAQPEHS